MHQKITILYSFRFMSFLHLLLVRSFIQSVNHFMSFGFVSFRFVRFHVISISCHAILLFSIISRHLVNPTDTDGIQRASYRSPCRYNTFLFMKLPPRLAQALHNPSYSIILYHNPLRSTRSIIVIHNLSYLLIYYIYINIQGRIFPYPFLTRSHRSHVCQPSIFSAFSWLNNSVAVSPAASPPQK